MSDSQEVGAIISVNVRIFQCKHWAHFSLVRRIEFFLLQRAWLSALKAISLQVSWHRDSRERLQVASRPPATSCAILLAGLTGLYKLLLTLPLVNI